MSKRNNVQAKNTAVETAAVEAAPVVETNAVEPIAVEVAAPAPVAVEWQPMPNYLKTVTNTVARAQVAPATPAGAAAPAAVHVLLSHTTPTVRPGTARAAALAALAGCIGQPRPAVLQAVTQAEFNWHRANGRTPGNLAPTGWLRTFNAVFGPAPVAVETPVEA